VIHPATREMDSLVTGELQRASLAPVIVRETPVLLLDEPTSALDIGRWEMVMSEIVMSVLRSLAGERRQSSPSFTTSTWQMPTRIA